MDGTTENTFVLVSVILNNGESNETSTISYSKSKLVQAVALVYECGEDLQTKAVCLDKGLDFDVGDVISADMGPLAGNRLFRGGEVSILLHEEKIIAEIDEGSDGKILRGLDCLTSVFHCVS